MSEVASRTPEAEGKERIFLILPTGLTSLLTTPAAFAAVNAKGEEIKVYKTENKGVGKDDPTLSALIAELMALKSNYKVVAGEDFPAPAAPEPKKKKEAVVQVCCGCCCCCRDLCFVSAVVSTVIRRCCGRLRIPLLRFPLLRFPQLWFLLL